MLLLKIGFFSSYFINLYFSLDSIYLVWFNCLRSSITVSYGLICVNFRFNILSIRLLFSCCKSSSCDFREQVIRSISSCCSWSSSSFKARASFLDSYSFLLFHCYWIDILNEYHVVCSRNQYVDIALKWL